MRVFLLFGLFLLGVAVSAQTELVLEYERIRSLSYSPDQQSLLVTTGDSCSLPPARMLITNDYSTIAQTFTMMPLIPDHEVVCSHYGVWSPTGTKIASSGDDGTVRIWDALTSEQITFDSTNFMSGVFSLSWRASETHVAAVSAGDQGLYILNTATGEETFFLTLKRPTGARWHPSHPNLIAVLEQDGSLRLWDVPYHQVFKMLISPDNSPKIGAVWSPDGYLLAYATRSSLEIFNVEAESVVKVFPIEEDVQILGLSWSIDGKIVLVVTDHSVRLWDMETGQLLQDIESNYWPTAAIGKISERSYILAYADSLSKGLQTITFQRP